MHSLTLIRNLAHSVMNTDVGQLRSIGELNRALLELEEYENSLAASIKKYELRRTELDEKLQELGNSLPKMSALNKEAVGLSAIVSNAATIGIQLSGKVRQLDVAKNRVQNVEALIGHVITLCKCLDDTQKALESNNVVEAAKSISIFLGMDDQTISLAETLEKENVGLSILPKLKELHLEVISRVSESFDNFVTVENTKAIEELFRIFPIIRKHELGLTKYGKYIATKIGEKAETQFAVVTSTQSFDKPNVHVDLMTYLLELAAQAIQTNEPVIHDSYGGDSLLNFICMIQTQCDHHAEIIFMDFKEKRDLSVILQRARHELLFNNRPSTFASSGAGQNKQSLLWDYCLSTESLISDSVLFNARIELYLNFLRRRLSTGTLQKNEKEHGNSAEIRQFFNQCGLSKISQEIVDAYLPLEQLFLRELVNKAITMDELDESTRIFRLVDDVFFVVKKCLSRAISSGCADAVCAMFNHTSAVLCDQLIEEALTPRTKSCTSSGWIKQAYQLVHKRAGSGNIATGLLGTANTESASNGSGYTSAGNTVDPQTQYLYALNSLEACLNCLIILRDTLEKYIEEVFGLRPKSDLGKLQVCPLTLLHNLVDMGMFALLTGEWACLSDLIDSLSRAFQTLIDGGFDQLRSVIRPQVNSLTQSFNSVKRDLSEVSLQRRRTETATTTLTNLKEFEQYAVNDPWVESLIVGLQSLLKPFHATLSAGNYEKFLSLLVDEILFRLERFVQQKSYNRYGALQFEKELRCIFNFFSSLSTFSCREKFARILQISKLLNLEKVEEVSYYGDASNWRLSANEIRRLLTLRVDFNAEEIRRLHL
ncbi:Conserved oligomeric Golgi complex subunit [Echinococcus granulosus]|uniref:Conserved oligomeric Golgi complex subunit 4 n=1 Tax=Echinococcus granulosus TaxID=6210 RepID=W6VB54_ECHGR|nr:Conserved oligomeric Golgi complex subunit [Echinococcus granulosus]EUB63994.1 Conserved oligomeric Golgi complex subunit [Echinococcus granulosus]